MLGQAWHKRRVNTLRPRRNGRQFADDIFECIFSNDNICISMRIFLKFVPNGLIKSIPALVQLMAWRRRGAKPLSEPMMVNLPTHICVTRPQWVKKETIKMLSSMLPKVYIHRWACKMWPANIWYTGPGLPFEMYRENSLANDFRCLRDAYHFRHIWSIER